MASFRDFAVHYNFVESFLHQSLYPNPCICTEKSVFSLCGESSCRLYIYFFSADVFGATGIAVYPKAGSILSGLGRLFDHRYFIDHIYSGSQ
ncbi:hypothetical protein D3C80_1406110 [compost metagenome]